MFGTGECDASSSKCRGFDESQICNHSDDCEPGHFCDAHSKCRKLKPPQEKCSKQEECEISSLCLFSDPKSLTGICVEFFSLSNNEQALHSIQTSSFVFPYPEVTDLLCQSGFVNPKTRKCEQAPLSQNKYSNCESDKDCTTSVTDYFGSCKCGLRLTGSSKVCYPVRGDDEGLEEILYFKKFLTILTGKPFFVLNDDDTKKLNASGSRTIEQGLQEDACHIGYKPGSEDWRKRWTLSNCGKEKTKIAYKEWRCASIKFLHQPFLESLKVLKCLTDNKNGSLLMRNIPILSEYHQFCENEFILKFER